MASQRTNQHPVAEVSAKTKGLEITYEDFCGRLHALLERAREYPTREEPFNAVFEFVYNALAWHVQDVAFLARQKVRMTVLVSPPAVTSDEDGEREKDKTANLTLRTISREPDQMMWHAKFGVRFIGEGKAAARKAVEKREAIESEDEATEEDEIGEDEKFEVEVEEDSESLVNAEAYGARAKAPHMLAQLCDQGWTYLKSGHASADHITVCFHTSEYWSAVKFTKPEETASRSESPSSMASDYEHTMQEAGAERIVNRALDQLEAEEKNLSFNITVVAYCEPIDDSFGGCNGFVIKTIAETKAYPDQETVKDDTTWTSYFANYPSNAARKGSLVEGRNAILKHEEELLQHSREVVWALVGEPNEDDLKIEAREQARDNADRDWAYTSDDGDAPSSPESKRARRPNLDKEVAGLRSDQLKFYPELAETQDEGESSGAKTPDSSALATQLDSMDLYPQTPPRTSPKSSSEPGPSAIYGPLTPETATSGSDMSIDKSPPRPSSLQRYVPTSAGPPSPTLRAHGSGGDVFFQPLRLQGGSGRGVPRDPNQTSSSSGR